MAEAPRFSCPRCDKALDAADAGLRCGGCQVDFPEIAGIPWLFAEPSTALAEWRGRLNFAVKKLDHDVGSFRDALTNKELHNLTRKRLERLSTVTEDHARRLRGLLEPLEIEGLAANYESYLALRTRLPTDQGLTTYYGNVHRDWAWGAKENEASARLILDALGGDAPGDTLVLGAGAGRLAYDIHMQAESTLTVASDFNPLLLFIGKRVMQGDSIELYEFPIAPASMEDEGVLRTLSCETPVRENFHFVLADALRPPFPEKSFNTIVTPWLVDILSEDFAILARRVNRLLASGGRWINFGSLAFAHPNAAMRYSFEEAVALTEEAGFGSPEITEERIPYMQSPASRHGREETVVTWSATKKKNATRPERYQSLPEWLVKGTDPVPALDSFKTQALSTRIYAFIMSLIDGKRSVRDIAELMVEQRLMAASEAEPAIRSFLIRMHEDSERTSGF